MCRNGGCCGHTSHADVRLPAAVGMAVGVASSAAAAALAHDVLAAVAWVLYGVVIPAMSVWVVVLIRRGRPVKHEARAAGAERKPAAPLAIEAARPVPPDGGYCPCRAAGASSACENGASLMAGAA